MALLDTLLAIERLQGQKEEALIQINQYVQNELMKNHEENGTISNDGNKRTYKEPEKRRLVKLFKKDYEELLKATQNNKFKNLIDIAEEFNRIYTEYFNKYNIDARLPEDKKSEVLSLESSSHEIRTHQCLLDYLDKQNLADLKAALDTLVEHYSTNRLKKFMNTPLPDGVNIFPILYTYVHRIILSSNNQRKNNKQFTEFVSQAIQLLVQYGADTKPHENLYTNFPKHEIPAPLLHIALPSYANLLTQTYDNLLTQIIFKTLVDVGADPTTKNNNGHSLLYSLLIPSQFEMIRDFYASILIVECGVKPDKYTEHQASIADASSYLRKNFNLLNKLKQERQETEAKYRTSSNFLSLFSFPQPLIDLTLEYHYSPAFLQSIKKTKVKLKPSRLSSNLDFKNILINDNPPKHDGAPHEDDFFITLITNVKNTLIEDTKRNEEGPSSLTPEKIQGVETACISIDGGNPDRESNKDFMMADYLDDFEKIEEWGNSIGINNLQELVVQSWANEIQREYKKAFRDTCYTSGTTVCISIVWVDNKLTVHNLTANLGDSHADVCCVEKISEEKNSDDKLIKLERLVTIHKLHEKEEQERIKKELGSLKNRYIGRNQIKVSRALGGFADSPFISDTFTFKKTTYPLANSKNKVIFFIATNGTDDMLKNRIEEFKKELVKNVPIDTVAAALIKCSAQFKDPSDARKADNNSFIISSFDGTKLKTAVRPLLFGVFNGHHGPQCARFMIDIGINVFKEKIKFALSSPQGPRLLKEEEDKRQAEITNRIEKNEQIKNKLESLVPNGELIISPDEYRNYYHYVLSLNFGHMTEGDISSDDDDDEAEDSDDKQSEINEYNLKDIKNIFLKYKYSIRYTIDIFSNSIQLSFDTVSNELIECITELNDKISKNVSAPNFPPDKEAYNKAREYFGLLSNTTETTLELKKNEDTIKNVQSTETSLVISKNVDMHDLLSTPITTASVNEQDSKSNNNINPQGSMLRKVSLYRIPKNHPDEVKFNKPDDLDVSDADMAKSIFGQRSNTAKKFKG